MSYVFEGEKIKINEKDFNRMQQMYQNINLMAELDQLDLELRDEKKWWLPLQAKLNYRNKNAPKKQVAYYQDNVAHLNRSTRDITLEEELSDTSWSN